MGERFYPENLRKMRSWVLWKREERDGRITKVPYSAKSGRKASSTNSRTWSSFEQAERMFESSGEFDGLGIVIAPESRLVFLDVDHCFDSDGGISDIGADVLSVCAGQTFIERSQSGTGLHVLAFGTIPKSYKNSVRGVEMYCEGRYCALTGDALSACEVTNIQPILDSLYDKYKTKEREQVLHSNSRTDVSKGDEWIIQKASEHGNFASLYQGNWNGLYKSQSEADIALLEVLAFWTNCNDEAMDRIFRSSGLNRKKWEDRPDYRVRTIENACSHIKETLNEFVDRTRVEEARRFEDAFLSRW